MYSFSRAFVHPQSSPIRDLFKYLSDPEMISFAGGYPDPRLFDAEGLQQASERAFQDSLMCLQYGSTEGTAKLRAQIQALMAERGAQVALDQIQVTTGSQQAFDLLLRVMLDDGDLVYAESPAYPNNIQALRVLGARIEGVPVDSDGLVVERLEEMLRAGGRPKLVYTVPTFGNPTGATLSLARRRRLLELAVEFRFLVVEDDPYGDLRFSGEPLPSLLALASGWSTWPACRKLSPLACAWPGALRRSRSPAVAPSPSRAPTWAARPGRSRSQPSIWPADACRPIWRASVRPTARSAP